MSSVARGRLRAASPPPLVAAAGGLILALLGAGIAVAAVSNQVSVDNLGALVLAIPFAVSGLVITRHDPGNAVGWIILASAAFLIASTLGTDYSIYHYRLHRGDGAIAAVAVMVQPSWAPAIVCMALSILLFPDGRVPGGSWGLALGAFLLLALAWQVGAFAIAVHAIATGSVAIAPGGDLRAIDHPTGAAVAWGYVQEAFFPALGLSALAWLARQLVRLRHARGDVRQQLKWLASGGALTAICGIGSVTTPAGVSAFVQFGMMAYPITIAVAILRHRLYEIDRIVSRTITYAVLTALLAGTFIGVVALTTNVLPLSGRAGVAASTLAAAALFNPLRRRVQRVVDRRFNRARYDAEAILGAFTARIRDALDGETVGAELLTAVERAVEPASASVWVRPLGAGRR